MIDRDVKYQLASFWILGVWSFTSGEACRRRNANYLSEIAKWNNDITMELYF